MATKGQLEQALRDELVALWSDMTQARRDAAYGGWSIGCDWLAQRIITLSRLVGPTFWDEVEVATLLDGTYEKVYTGAGIEYQQIDWGCVREVDEANRAGR